MMKTRTKHCKQPGCKAVFYGPRAGQALGGHNWQAHGIRGAAKEAAAAVEVEPRVKRKYTRRAPTKAKPATEGGALFVPMAGPDRERLLRILLAAREGYRLKLERLNTELRGMGVRESDLNGEDLNIESAARAAGSVSPSVRGYVNGEAAGGVVV